MKGRCSKTTETRLLTKNEKYGLRNRALSALDPWFSFHNSKYVFRILSVHMKFTKFQFVEEDRKFLSNWILTFKKRRQPQGIRENIETLMRTLPPKFSVEFDFLPGISCILRRIDRTTIILLIRWFVFAFDASSWFLRSNGSRPSICAFDSPWAAPVVHSNFFYLIHEKWRVAAWFAVVSCLACSAFEQEWSLAARALWSSEDNCAWEGHSYVSELSLDLNSNWGKH